MSGSEYVLGTDAAELARLGLQHRLWSGAAHALWERAAIRPGLRVLDVGCGPGFAAFDMAQIVGPGGKVLGVDESDGFVAYLKEQAAARGLAQLTAVTGDVQRIGEALRAAGVPSGSFDFAYVRWVLCFVPDPDAVVRGLAGALRAGAKLTVQDYFDYESMTLAPRRPEFSRVIEAVGSAWRDRGGDPDIMARLPGMLSRHGFRVEHLGMNPRIARPGSTMWAWPDAFWKNFVPRLVAMGKITEGEREAFERAWSEASSNPGAFMLLPPVFDLVAERE